MDSKSIEPKPGDTVTLIREPEGLLSGLPKEDRVAISKIVGTPILLVAYGEDGRAELKFTGSDGVVHFVYVDPSEIRAVKEKT